ncbi:ComEC/Rec2 family competence protein [Proteiniclasticum sp. C24MP]|uniref:ComEC/Rec2 family competence protein n=1 Tax=Proteiniclasticum sp. C24MP TaxID=3374101 RepID=UPI0037547F49
MRKRTYLPMILFVILLASLVGIYFILDYGIVGVEKSTEVSRIQSVNAPVKVHYMDIGQGDSIFMEVNGKNILIDAGEEEHAATIIEYLKTYDVEKLDLVFLTHPHEDHIGGMGDVLSAFEIGEFYAPDKDLVTRSFIRMTRALEEKNIPRKILKGGMEFAFGESVTLQILSPNRDSYLNPNNYSPIMRLVVGTNAFLFTGDAEELVENEVIRTGMQLKSDVLKSPHHGSKTSSSKAFLDKVDPAYIVVTSGLGNDHNLPSPEILERYESIGARTLLTEEMGSIVFAANGKEVIPLTN